MTFAIPLEIKGHPFYSYFQVIPLTKVNKSLIVDKFYYFPVRVTNALKLIEQLLLPVTHVSSSRQ